MALALTQNESLHNINVIQYDLKQVSLDLRTQERDPPNSLGISDTAVELYLILNYMLLVPHHHPLLRLE